LDTKKKNEFKRFWIAKAFILVASFCSMIFSIFLFYNKDTQNAIYVGLWVPSILSAGALLFAGKHE
jgi:hypothetical protein